MNGPQFVKMGPTAMHSFFAGQARAYRDEDMRRARATADESLRRTYVRLARTWHREFLKDLRSTMRAVQS